MHAVGEQDSLVGKGTCLQARGTAFSSGTHEAEGEKAEGEKAEGENQLL